MEIDDLYLFFCLVVFISQAKISSNMKMNRIACQLSNNRIVCVNASQLANKLIENIQLEYIIGGVAVCLIM